ncbi:inhibitor of apoptosis protein isoform X2 [Galleria mellonella]|uniref:Inhibitor of apoptosis protein isoform X2 n=1 Tax=Galleria mellonella TaxID=7137 RepID=A0A6J1W893_GALME|nr:inhibitor of apoptosis protein isoform X2 [Galleria mellonella]
MAPTSVATRPSFETSYKNQEILDKLQCPTPSPPSTATRPPFETSFKNKDIHKLHCSTPSSSSTSSSTSFTSTPSPDKIDNRDRFNYCEVDKMQNVEERLKSFVNWPVPFLSPEKLAQCGFYYKGCGDEVICAYCNVEIMSWREGDDPAVDHKRWSPQCPLLRMESDTDNLSSCLLRRQPSTANLPISSTSTSGHDECGTRALPTKATPVHPQYATKAARLRTFNDWPLSMPQKPEDLADAGFYYTGKGDQTKCYFCNGGLKDWEKDDIPWEQHAKWFSRCYFVYLVKGREYVQKVLNSTQNNVSQTTQEKPETKTIPAAPTSSNSNIELEDTRKLCKVCYEDECNVVIVPCGHVCACAKCVLSTDRCPICRGSIDNTLRLYFS